MPVGAAVAQGVPNVFEKRREPLLNIGKGIRDRIRSGWRLLGCLAAQLRDGMGHFACILRLEMDGLAIEMQRSVLNGRSHDFVSLGGYASKLRQFEVAVTILFGEGDDLIRLCSADVEVLAAKLAPVVHAALVLSFVSKLPQSLSLGRGAATGDEAEGVVLAQHRAKLEQFGIGVGEFRDAIVHIDEGPLERSGIEDELR